MEMLDLVALLEEVRTTHFETDRPLMLRRGQIGTIVMTYDDGAVEVEVEFVDRDGRAFAILFLRPDKLMRLRDAPDYAVA
jgi:Domain of unknown function (DUF4926)